MSKIAPQPDSWREALKFINRCPTCSAIYDQEGARLFARRAGVNLVHITCDQCAGGFIALVMILGKGLSSVGMVTDLSYDDVSRLQRTEPLTLDEVLDAHQYFHNHPFLNFP